MVTSRKAEDLAIVGISCRFAGINGIADYWRTIMQRQTHFSENSNTDDIARADLESRSGGTSGAYLRELYGFTSDSFSARQTLPDEGVNADYLFTAQLAHEALEDAGFGSTKIASERVAMLIGNSAPLNVGTVNWLQHAMMLNQTIAIMQRIFPAAAENELADMRQQLTASLPPLAPSTISTAFNYTLAPLAAHALGLTGPAQTIDCGTLSSFRALRAGMDHLRLRRCDLALVGAIQTQLNRPMLAGLSLLLPQTNRRTLTPLNRDADGTLFGEGGGMLALCRRRDAEKRDLRIYAVIKELGIATGMPAANHSAAATPILLSVVQQVLRKCNVTAASVELQEAHGSGVPEEDLTEINALRELYGERHTSLPTIGVSAVKSSIGHTLACAGIASLQKAALALYHRILPPMANTQRPHARLCHPSTPFYLIGEARPWIQSGMGAPRRAGVTALDFSGACGHVLLEAHPEGI